MTVIVLLFLMSIIFPNVTLLSLTDIESKITSLTERIIMTPSNFPEFCKKLQPLHAKYSTSSKIDIPGTSLITVLFLNSISYA